MKEKIKKIMIMLDAGCVRRKEVNPQAQFDVWVKMFGNYSDMLLEDAAETWMKKSKYFPSIEEFLKEIIYCLQPSEIYTYFRLNEERKELVRLLLDGILVSEDWIRLADRFNLIGYVMTASALLKKRDRAEKALKLEG